MSRSDLMYDALKRSEGVAFDLWFFFGIIGAHRFYLKQIKSGILMLVLTCTVFGLVITGIWWVIDAFLIIGMTKEYNLEVIDRIDDKGNEGRVEPTL
jgi:TM2 domain-containing membrane protein YozV